MPSTDLSLESNGKSIDQPTHDRKQTDREPIDREQTDRKLAEIDSDRFFMLSADLFCIVDFDGCFRRVNPAFEQILGYTPDELLTKPLIDFVHVDDRAATIDEASRLSQGIKTVAFENRYYCKDGSYRWLSWTSAPYQEEQLIYAIARDITEYRQAAQDLQASKQLLQLVFDLLPQRVFWKDRQFRYLGCNKLFAQDAQLESPDQLIGKDDFEMIWKDIAHLYRADDEAIIQNDLSRINYEEPLLGADGTMSWVRTSKTPLRNEKGEIIGVFGTFEDITAYKQAQIAVAESETKYRRLVEDASDYIFAFSKEGFFTYISPQFTQLFGYDPCDFLGKPFAPLVHPDDLSLCRIAYDRLINTGKNEAGLEFRHRCQDDRWCWVSCNLSPIKNTEGDVIGYQGVMEDISDRKEAEAQLQEQEQFLRSIYDGVGCSIFVVDVLENGEFHYASHNHISEQLTGYQSAAVAGKSAAELFGAADGAAIDQLLSQCVNTRTVLTAAENLTFDGKQTWVMTTFNPLINLEGNVHRIVGTSFNITDLKQAEAQLQQQAADLEHALQELQRTQTQMVQSEKMSSLGQLVAGVAHEINNPVNFIYGNLNHANEYTQDLLKLLSLYEKHYPNPVDAIRAEAEAIDLEFLMADLPKLLGSLKVGADRIQKIVASLRSFSRLDEAEVKDVDIHDGIDSTLMILHNRLKSRSESPAIQVVKDYGNLPCIECYAGQLNQVFMNVLSNAIDALDEQNQSRSLVDTEEHPSVITIQTRVVDGDRVAIHIIDNGPGIPAAVQKRLFDPFFTTKAVGKGTGMGMSISHQVITERHRGQLTCDSIPGQGATFVIEIPMRQSA
ncbi:MAG: PAS domain-containing sensor histidine kinase [Lyngbya sp. HA4199-MV5]|jgi:PAS domain S-box-containing protein|nr:PAS domain-containing sensor histidine kinase [Lyngbya sp. HA4199-MV5]